MRHLLSSFKIIHSSLVLLKTFQLTRVKYTNTQIKYAMSCISTVTKLRESFTTDYYWL